MEMVAVMSMADVRLAAMGAGIPMSMVSVVSVVLVRRPASSIPQNNGNTVPPHPLPVPVISRNNDGRRDPGPMFVDPSHLVVGRF